MLDKANQTYAMEFKDYDQRNEYPTTIDQVAKALIKHKPDNRGKGPTTPRHTPRPNTAGGSAPDGVSNAQANAQTTSSRPAFSCWCCGDTGHGVTRCPKRSTRPQAEWSDPGRYSDAPTTTTSRRAGRANLQVPAAASAAQSDAASSVTGMQTTGQHIEAICNELLLTGVEMALLVLLMCPALMWYEADLLLMDDLMVELQNGTLHKYV
ncbi:unnamed protein product [Cylindrotheca closterium]|uniref:CCHC-type domain-containing protein n=1 Tax=Cylindrotheca closterium TaxID=2856 RepID=A0AAD2CNL3_9STRA|nr:unnamed protein product [Cylindrotheca closterium]